MSLNATGRERLLVSTFSEVSRSRRLYLNRRSAYSLMAQISQ